MTIKVNNSNTPSKNWREQLPGQPAQWRIAEVPSSIKTGGAVCPYCGVGCYLKPEIDETTGQITRILADSAHAPNFGSMCPKGAYMKSVFDPKTRLTQPLMRQAKGMPLEPVSWDQALNAISIQIHKTIQSKGPDALALYGSGQLDTEASYIYTKLFKGFLACNHTDSNSRLCMSSAVAGYVSCFGADAPPTCYEDIDLSHNFLITGANMASNHPVLFNRIRKRRTTEEQARIIVVDPRETETSQYADLHLQIKPGSDVALTLYLSRRLLDLDRIDLHFVSQHADHFEAYKAHLLQQDLESLQQQCGVPLEQLNLAVDWLSRDLRFLSFYCMGYNQSIRGVDKNTSLINLHMMMGEVAREGSGPFSLTGQPNAMGGREVGYLSHQLPGYRSIKNPRHRAELEELWRLPEGHINAQPGRQAIQIFEAADAGDLDLLWIACTNPVVSMPKAGFVQDSLSNVGMVIVQDCYLSNESIQFADIVLPAAQWSEKSGTMTNSERLINRSHQVLDPPGEAKPDWWIFTEVARRLGFAGFDFNDADSIWTEYASLTAGTNCDQSGITNEMLNEGAVHWPCSAGSFPQSRRYMDRQFPTSTGNAQFICPEPLPPGEEITDAFPLILTTGRISTQWHTRTRTGLVPELNQRDQEAFVEIHPDDVAPYNLQNTKYVKISSRRGSAIARLRVSKKVSAGVAFSTFHYGDSFHPDANLNRTTQDKVDAISGQPELKYAAVNISPCPRPDDWPYAD